MFQEGSTTKQYMSRSDNVSQSLDAVTVTMTDNHDELHVLPLPPHSSESTDKGLKVTQRFLSQDDIKKYLNCFCRGEIEGLSNPPGYAVNIRRSYVSKNLVEYICDRGRMPRCGLDQQVKKRQRESKKIGCPFSLQARRSPDGAYDLYISNKYHNHSSSLVVDVHSSLRRPNEREINEQLRTIIKEGKSHEAQLAIQEATKCPVTKQDIYNLKRKFGKIND